MADGLLWLLNRGWFHAQTFADDFVWATFRSELIATFSTQQYMLEKVTSWCLETGFKVNPDKTELFVSAKFIVAS